MRGRRQLHTGLWWGNPKGKRPLGKPKRGWEDKMDLQEVGWGAGTGLIWFRTGAGDGLL